MEEKILLLNQLTLILTFVSTILWGIYVIYTIRTFKEIKSQTDLQIRAFAVVKHEVTEVNDTHDTVKLKDALTIYGKWEKILQQNLAQATDDKKVLLLKVTNRGSSDIVEWKVTIDIEIKPGKFLETEANITGDKCGWVIESESNQTIAPNEEIVIPIGFIGSFPYIKYKWNIWYEDSREQSYEHNSEKNCNEFHNMLAFDKKPSNDSEIIDLGFNNP